MDFKGPHKPRSIEKPINQTWIGYHSYSRRVSMATDSRQNCHPLLWAPPCLILTRRRHAEQESSPGGRHHGMMGTCKSRSRKTSGHSDESSYFKRIDFRNSVVFWGGKLLRRWSWGRAGTSRIFIQFKDQVSESLLFRNKHTALTTILWELSVVTRKYRNRNKLLTKIAVYSCGKTKMYQ